MAVTKIWAIKDSLQRVLDYAANPDKTEYDALAQTLHYAENDAKTKLNESAQLVTGIHCRPDHAWEDMRAVQKRFGKTDGVVALHAYQSFREGEVTPEQSHKIGMALARKVWGKRFQVLVATHMNTDNLLKLRAVVCLGRDGTVNVVLDDGDAILFGISRTFPDLTFDGFFALVVTGIAGIDHSGHGRHPTLHIIKRRTVLSKCSLV